MIRLLSLFILFICSTNTIGQTSSKEEYILKYSIGHYNFGNTGEYERTETFKFKLKHKYFVLTEFQSITNRYEYNPETLLNDHKVSDTIIKFLDKKNAKEEIENLVVQLNQNGNNFNTDFLNQKNLGKISKKDILKIAKQRDQTYLFIDEETEKVDDQGKQRIKKIQNFKDFEKYLEEIRPKTDVIMVVSDAWNYARLGYANSTLTDKMDFNSILGQPIQKNNSSDQIINLNVNLILLKILPKESLLSKKVDFANLKADYINWFIENIK